MQRLKARRWPQIALLAACVAGACGILHSAGPDLPSFNGGQAFQHLKRVVGFGPRPAGSKASADCRRWIIAHLRQMRCKVEEDPFSAATPLGPLPMANVVVKFPGKRSTIVIIGGHYDTKRFGEFSFVGANDAGSSTAFLLEMVRVLAQRRNDLTYWLVFFDGEEAIQTWSSTDGLYGSRHLVEKLTANGELSRVGALLLVDMVADRSLQIHRDFNSTEWLSDLVFGVARRLGYGKYFANELRGIEDDHVPFVQAGVASVDLIDFEYGPYNRYWHTAEDTLDKCSPVSLTIVGRVVLASLDELERSPRLR